MIAWNLFFLLLPICGVLSVSIRRREVREKDVVYRIELELRARSIVSILGLQHKKGRWKLSTAKIRLQYQTESPSEGDIVPPTSRSSRWLLAHWVPAYLGTYVPI